MLLVIRPAEAGPFAACPFRGHATAMTLQGQALDKTSDPLACTDRRRGGEEAPQCLVRSLNMIHQPSLQE